MSSAGGREELCCLFWSRHRVCRWCNPVNCLTLFFYLCALHLHRGSAAVMVIAEMTMVMRMECVMQPK